MESLYPIRAVAKITGLSVDTLRAWERRYQAVVPARTNRGRQYGSDQVERLLLLSKLVQKGHAIGQVAPLANPELQDLLAQQPGRTAPETESQLELIAHILSAVEDFDAARARDELSRLAAILAPRDLVYRVAVPLMTEVGNRWHQGTMAVGQEHLISEILRNLFGSLMQLFRPAATSIKMVLATPSGESHEFGILAGAMLASMAGIEPIYLGPNLPAREIAAVADRTGAKVVVLGITVPVSTTAEEVTALAAAMPKDAELWIGGASNLGLDFSTLSQRTVLLKDLSMLEDECCRQMV